MTITNVARRSLPPHPVVVFYDGECGLCQRSIRFIARRDRSRRFRFAPLGGPAAAVLLGGRFAAGAGDTLVLLDDAGPSTRSTAALRIARHLSWPWPLLAVMLVVPRPVRDAAYDLVARHRYRWFGRADACAVPPAALRDRLLE